MLQVFALLQKSGSSGLGDLFRDPNGVRSEEPAHPKPCDQREMSKLGSVRFAPFRFVPAFGFPFSYLVGRPGLDPGTLGLKVRARPCQG